MKYEEMVTRLKPRLKAISHKVCTRYTYCDSDDFLQEALLHLWLMHGNGSLEDKTESYILQGCYFFLKNYIRKICKSVDANSVSLFALVEDGEYTLGDTLVSDAYIKDTASVEIFLLLDEVDRNFNEREKDVFYYQMEGYTTREIGEKIGISHVMVVKTRSRIKEKCEKLRDELEW
ncbi:MAG: sigma-70 family RNA polymerase sigma factor [Candidatus Omnitrophica bacterium]|nr:sigma-70 family RNA polymerase sigma factor [Candidatus Omnitrophota bacterium]